MQELKIIARTNTEKHLRIVCLPFHSLTWRNINKFNTVEFISFTLVCSKFTFARPHALDNLTGGRNKHEYNFFNFLSTTNVTTAKCTGQKVQRLSADVRATVTLVYVRYRITNLSKTALHITYAFPLQYVSSIRTFLPTTFLNAYACTLFQVFVVWSICNTARSL